MATTRARTAALILTAGLALAGCSSDGNDKQTPAGQQQAAGPTGGPPPSTPAVDCADTSLSMGDWTLHCGPGTGNTIKQTGAAPTAAAPMQLGQSVETTGERGGTLELTPTTVVYSTGEQTGTVPDRDGYITVTVKERNTGAVPTNALQGFGGGWDYLAPDGEAITTGVMIGGSFKITGTTVQPGTFVWSGVNFDIRNDQRGGTIQYTDGTGVTYRWQLPAVDTGPQIAEVKKGLK